MARTPVARSALLTLALLLLGLAHPASSGSLAHNAVFAQPVLPSEAQPAQSEPPEGWRHLSSAYGEIPVAGPLEQTATQVLDVDRDGVNDFVIAGRGAAPAIVWYQRQTTGWTRYVVEAEELPIEAGGAVGDVDGDGDLDLIFGGDYSNNDIFWWENPYPNYSPETPWRRHLIKGDGARMHHDMLFGDFDHDGADELVFWNQDDFSLFMAEIPADPRAGEPWPRTRIFSQRNVLAEGLAKADVDGDGLIDLVAGGRWFKHRGDGRFTSYLVDKTQAHSRVAVGQLKPGGRPEMVFVPGDDSGRLKWYEWNGSSWKGHDLLGVNVTRGHSLEIGDINGDGHLDIFCAEMRLNGSNWDAKAWIFYGDGRGNFTTTVLSSGYDNHESRLADLDGDGDLDILSKPYNHETPRLDVWLNEAPRSSKLALNQWQRHVVDAERPGRAIFITAGDLDGDGLPDIVTGGVWYRNTGVAAGPWERRQIGAPLANMAAIFDVDGDKRLDILGTRGDGANANADFVWARNNGDGSFTTYDTIARGSGDFLQGVAVARFQPDGPVEVALSWHAPNKGLQMLSLPASPTFDTWPWRRVSTTSQDEALSVGDIDRDGDLDLLLGTKWLRNNGTSWSTHTLNSTSGLPDRNRLADINGDGRLDAVVGFEAISAPGKLAWYEQGSSPTSAWKEHVIGTVVGPMSLDVADMDGDGDLDIVVGEHNLSRPERARLLLFENLDGRGGTWVEHVIYTGDEHHDGAQLVDIDGDGDLDIISIGWGHNRVLLYENKARDPVAPPELGPTPAPPGVEPSPEPPEAEPSPEPPEPPGTTPSPEPSLTPVVGGGPKRERVFLPLAGGP
jgi:hypothetical protein